MFWPSSRWPTLTLPIGGTSSCRPTRRQPADDGRLVEWRFTDSGWIQVTTDAKRAGSALVNFAVDDLERHVADLTLRGLHPGEIETVNKGVKLSAITDPDGNTITFIGNFRVNY